MALSLCCLDIHRRALEDLIATNPLGHFFKDLTQEMKDFLLIEKNHLFRVDETRCGIDPAQKIVTGFKHTYTPLSQPYDPQDMTPFKIKGVWIPEKDSLFFESERDKALIVKRKTSEGNEFLFLIHPLSEKLFAELLHRYQPSEDFVAFALSSARSLLVSFPTETEKRAFAIIKVSLDQEIGGTRRLLTLKECGSSVFINQSIAKRALPIRVFPEEFAFVPRHASHACGMIYRCFTEEFKDPNILVAPLYAIFGEKNLPFLLALIEQSGCSPEDFIEEKLLRPLAALWIDLLFVHKTSLEIHGQNLLILINKEKDAPFQFAYRDLGGVNRIPSTADEIPAEFSWASSHKKDAATALEHFSYKVLFNLTKLFFNQPLLFSKSPRFLAWKETMEMVEFDKNWKSQESHDQHLTKIPLRDFCRYGYFEKKFGEFLLNELDAKDFFVSNPQTKIDLQLKLSDPTEVFSQCLKNLWFEELILKL